MTTYKWLLKGRITPTQRTVWPKRVGAWTEKQKPVLCKSGWHGVEFGQITQHIADIEFDVELWEVEDKGAIVRGTDKFAAEQMRLVRLVGVMDERTSRLAACDFAESVLHVYEDKYPGDTRPRDCIAVARRYADGLATREELNTAIADAARAAGAAATPRGCESLRGQQGGLRGLLGGAPLRGPRGCEGCGGYKGCVGRVGCGGCCGRCVGCGGYKGCGD